MKSKALIAEVIGTFALIFIGAGAGAIGVGGLVGVALAHGLVIHGRGVDGLQRLLDAGDERAGRGAADLLDAGGDGDTPPDVPPPLEMSPPNGSSMPPPEEMSPPIDGIAAVSMRRVAQSLGVDDEPLPVALAPAHHGAVEQDVVVAGLAAELPPPMARMCR